MATDVTSPGRPDVSVCVATFRRPRGLARLLASLLRQKLPDGLAFEILVVDNDPRGGARESVPPELARASNLRWLAEPRQNIAHARNAALEQARGDWIAFIDDDEEAGEDWLASFWAGVECDAGDAFFGPVTPLLEVEPRPWLDAPTFYGRTRHASGTPLGVEAVSTSNAFVRRAALGDHRFDPDWGRTGGEDVELFDRLLRGGARCVWWDEAEVSERVPAQRYGLRWLSRRAFNGGLTHTRLVRRHRSPARIAVRAALAGVACVLALPLALLSGRRNAARLWLRVCTQAGHLWALSGRVVVAYDGDPARPNE